MAVTPWLDPSAQLNGAGWTTPANVYAQDGANATRTVSGVGVETPYFRIYGFNSGGTSLATLVSGATSIDGFEVQWYGRTSNTPQYAYGIIGNAPAGSPQTPAGSEKTIAAAMPVSGTTSAYGTIIGGPTDKWAGKNTGGLVWLPSDLDANFGISGAWASNSATMDVVWDHVRMRVYYSVAGGAKSLMMMGVGS